MKIEYICLNCGEKFKDYVSRNRKCCSKKCRYEYLKGENSPHWKGGLIEYICKNCGEKFEDYPSCNRECCSNACKYEIHGSKVSGDKHPNYGKTFEELYGDKAEGMIEKMRKGRAKVVYPKKDSSIEITIQNLLEELELGYRKHTTLKKLGMKESDETKLLYYQVDLVLSAYKLVIECDGNYWHCFPYGRVKDFYINDIVKNNDWKILRLWESEIKTDLEACRNKILSLMI